MNRLLLASIWIAIQAGALIGWTVMETARLAPDTGTSIVVRTVPVDPRDLLRGQYIQLEYPFSRFPNSTVSSAESSIWVVLRPVKSGNDVFHEPVEYLPSKRQFLQPGEVQIRGDRKPGNRLVFGIERYFVAEGTETPAADEITVRLRIGEDCRPRIETVFVRGLAWPPR